MANTRIKIMESTSLIHLEAITNKWLKGQDDIEIQDITQQHNEDKYILLITYKI